MIKTIAILVTGNEIVEGDVQDKNAHHFAQALTEQNARVKQQVFVPDDKEIIRSQLVHLLAQHDAVIISGGLGPTSDDLTRFALSQAVDKPLILSEQAYTYLSDRLRQFGLQVTNSNQQQALFPEGSILISNPNGTAMGCYLRWNNRDIFMLPGPPKECWPMFDAFVLPYLSKGEYFLPMYKKRFFTLGLLEGEIASKIDEVAIPAGVETGYRWTYPYLEIKLQMSCDAQWLSIEKDILNLVLENSISIDSCDDAVTRMNLLLSQSICITGTEKVAAIVNKWNSPYLVLGSKIAEKDNAIFVHYDITPELSRGNRLLLHVSAFRNGKNIYEHQLSILNRDADVDIYLEHYLAWQLYRILLLSS